MRVPRRPKDDEAHPKDSTWLGADARRPADVWLPLGGGHAKRMPEAWEIAVASGMRQASLKVSVGQPECITKGYAAFKEAYQDTKERCIQNGLVFTPVVFEAHGGGFGKAARRVLDCIANQQMLAGAWSAEGVSLKIAQRISCTLHRETARAILKRLSAGREDLPGVEDLGGDPWTEILAEEDLDDAGVTATLAALSVAGGGVASANGRRA